MPLRRVSLAVATIALLAQPLGAAPPAPVAEAAPPIDPVTGLYQPVDKDERGLWMQVDEQERLIKTSPLLITDPKLNDYIRSVFCRTVGAAQCKPVRIYILRTPEFNATMAPNGMLTVLSGLLLRTRNEAQLAAVLGHEYTHYQLRHTIQQFRNVREASGAAIWLRMAIGVLGPLLVASSLYEHSREMEHDADVGGLALMAKAGYDTREAAKIWEQLRAEMDATAEARNTKSRKDHDGGMFATHPPSAERVTYLTEAAKSDPGTPGETGAAPFAAVMRDYWPELIDDQLKRNDFGASEYLITALAANGPADWLSYAHGELYRHRAGPGDLEKSVAYYTEGLSEGSMPQLWRGRGLARMKLGQTDDGRADLKPNLTHTTDAPDRPMIAMMAGGS